MRLLILLLALGACGPETTAFRTTDKGDERMPGAAAYQVDVGPAVAHVFVWSNGGYLSSGEEPMTHVGFEIANVGGTPFDFDADALRVSVLGRGHQLLPPARFAMVTPLGPAQVTIPPGTTLTLDSYFVLPVRPRAVDAMRVTWALRAGDVVRVEETNFVRSDGYPVFETNVPSS